MWLQNDPWSCIANHIFVHFSTFYESHLLQIDISEHLIAKAIHKFKGCERDEFKCLKLQNTKLSIATTILCILQFSWFKPVLDDSIHICVELTFAEDLSNESQIQKQFLFAFYLQPQLCAFCVFLFLIFLHISDTVYFE